VSIVDDAVAADAQRRASIGEFERQVLDALRAEGSVLASIRDKREIVKETDDKLKAFLGDFAKKFA